MGKNELMDKYLATLDPNQKGNRVDEILRTYVGVANLKEPIDGHMEHLEGILFGTLEDAVRACGASDGKMEAIKYVKDVFSVHARAYLTSRASKSCIPTTFGRSLKKDYHPVRSSMGAKGVGLMGPAPGC